MRDLGFFPPIRFYAVLVTSGLLGCGETPLEVNGSPSQTLSIKAGRELELSLQTIGPGEYASPPLVSSAVVRFLDVQLMTPAVPARPRQRFRFEAVRPGATVSVFITQPLARRSRIPSMCTEIGSATEAPYAERGGRELFASIGESA